MRYDQQVTSSQGSTQIEVTSRLSELYQVIEERHPSLSRELNNVGGDDEHSEDDENAEDVEDDEDDDDDGTGDEDDDSNRKIDYLCDILSSFDKSRTPSEYKRDVVNQEQRPVSFEDILIPGNIYRTIYRLAIYDGAFFRRLRQVVSPNLTAMSYFNKQHWRAQLAIQCLHQYARLGPQSGHPSENG